MAKLSETRVSLAQVIPWSLVLVLGTVFVTDFTHQSFAPSVVNNTDTEGPDDKGPQEPEVDLVATALSKVTKEYKNIEDKEDKILIYKLLSGAAEYLKHAKKLKDTSQFDPILGKVQTSYGWEREKYPEFTDAVSDYLVASGYEEPRTLETPEDRAWFQAIFESLVGAIK